MNKTLLILLAILAWPAAAPAAPDFPPGTVWYIHADLEAMRDSKAGRDLYRWLEQEIFAEVREKAGIDVSAEVQRVTAYSGQESGVAIVMQGPVTQTTRDKLMALMATHSEYDIREDDGREYFLAGEEPPIDAAVNHLGDLDETAYVSFAIPDKVIVTSREQHMQALLRRKGRIVGGGRHNGALLVITADKTFVQAGLRAEVFADEGSGWNSNILRNTEQAALLVADRNGLLAIEAQLKSRDPRLTQSLGSVINGLFSLQAFNDDLDPGLRAMISNTRISAQDAVLNVSTVLDPAELMRLIGD